MFIKKFLNTVGNVFRVPELRAKIFFTCFIVLLYRLGNAIPVPYINNNFYSYFTGATQNSIFQYLNILSGQSLSKATLFALSISPYITASIVMQLLAVAFTGLAELQKTEDGRKKITAITRVVTVALALIMSIGYYAYMNDANMITEPGIFPAIVIVATYCAGAALIMWLAEKINESGIGNGISIILFVNIISSGPAIASALWNMLTGQVRDSNNAIIESSRYWGIPVAIICVLFVIAMVAFMVFITNSERRIPVQYAKKVVGRKMFGGQSSNLPIKLNMAGVMPIIFASSIVSIPATIGAFAGKTAQSEGFWGTFLWLFGPTSWLYVIAFLLLILAFSYFYIMISFNPVEVANNLKMQGGAIPGIRQGKPTSDFITKILSRVTFIGAVFLMIIAGIPMIVNTIASSFEFYALSGLTFGGSSMLIVIGVALETARDIESQMTLRHYKGFLG